ncbi:hypothetical protein HC928_20015 [bacterium]|nr:hypothetical protein [bacterium]
MNPLLDALLDASLDTLPDTLFSAFLENCLLYRLKLSVGTYLKAYLYVAIAKSDLAKAQPQISC